MPQTKVSHKYHECLLLVSVSNMTSVLQACVKSLSSTHSPLGAPTCSQSAFNLLQLLIIPIILTLPLRYLQALDDSFSFNKGMQGDKLSYAHVVFPLKKKEMLTLNFWLKRCNTKPLYYPPNHSVFTSHTQAKKETLTTYNIATTNIYLAFT